MLCGKMPLLSSSTRALSSHALRSLSVKTLSSASPRCPGVESVAALKPELLSSCAPRAAFPSIVHSRLFATAVKRAEKGDKVQLKYRGRLRSGHLIAEDEGTELEFEVGADEVIDGIEKAVLGMKVGDSKTVEIPPEYAYGPHIPELVFTLNQDQVPESFLKEAKVGFRVRLAEASEEEEEKWGTIVEVTPDSVTIDTNEPLAGELLIVDLELLSLN